MQFEQENYYHLYNRTNNEEVLFKQGENFDYFLNRYSKHVGKYFDTIAYCLMPTHFHFLVKAISNEQEATRLAIATLLSAYTKAINKRFNRHGSLFQPRTKARLINDETDLLNVITYIHQNPVRSKLVHTLDEWPHSSYSQIIYDDKRQIVDKK